MSISGGRKLLTCSALLLGSSLLIPSPSSAESLYSDVKDDMFLENWMGLLMPVLGDQTFLDLTMPGCHDCMSYDDSNTVTDGANDLPTWVSWILHNIHDLADAGDVIRDLSMTQGLDLTGLLNAGLRFIDFRLMYSAPPDKSSLGPHDWYSLHLVQSKQTAITYMKDLRLFLDTHPSEIVMLFLSRHGDQTVTGDDQYPNVKPEVKQAFFEQITTLFDGLIFDTSQSALNTTSLNELVQSNQRLIIMASDWVEFTGNSTLAINPAPMMANNGLYDNGYPGRVHDALSRFGEFTGVRDQMKANNQFYLQSLAGSGPDQLQVAWISYLPDFLGKEWHIKKCAEEFLIPGLDDWCPLSLVEGGQMSNYYNQLALEALVTGQDLHLPHALYLDAIDVGGRIRTGMQRLLPVNWSAVAVVEGRERETEERTARGLFVDAEHDTIGYAYVDTLLLHNLQRVCANKPGDAVCTDLISVVEARRAAAPVALWDDAAHGRLVGWPNY